MNILEEIAGSYTYNGSVSLMALEDDIETIENQIESDNITLREVRLRNMNDAPLVARIRENKIRLSLLKAVYKKESEKDTADNGMSDILGVSANNANEVEPPETAADKKEPVPQDFEKAEAEPEEKESESEIEEVEVQEDNEPNDVEDGYEEMNDPTATESVEEVVEDETDRDTFFNDYEYDDVLNAGDAVVSVDEVPLNDVPPPTIEDYSEPVNDMSVPVYERNNDDVDKSVIDVPDDDFFLEDFETFQDPQTRLDTYVNFSPFLGVSAASYASFFVDYKRRTLDIRLERPDDFLVFSELMKKMESDRGIINRFVKKQGSIFIITHI